MCFDCSGYGRSGGPTCSVELGENQGVLESMPCSTTHHRIVLVQGITTHFKDLLYYHQKMFAQKELSTRNGLKYRENWSNHFFDTLSKKILFFLSNFLFSNFRARFNVADVFRTCEHVIRVKCPKHVMQKNKI